MNGQTPVEYRTWLTADEAAAHLRCSRQTLKRYNAPFACFKRKKVYHRETLDKWAQCRIQSGATDESGPRKGRKGKKSPSLIASTRLKSGSQEITLVSISEALEKHQSGKPTRKRVA